ncbi:MAG: helix-turn-helix transcriptional regulator [Oscillospiraceae bacterium]|jgi:transcriptional regulator with XRE-family HTH domain|nr:helix-turn-helix transcriptional regulator [Oscillospiraceae bacterium]
MVTKDFFKARLRQLRKERGETQVQVSEATGIGERHYQKFEAGDNFPNVENLCALADHFEVSVDYLLGRTEEK